MLDMKSSQFREGICPISDLSSNAEINITFQFFSGRNTFRGLRYLHELVLSNNNLAFIDDAALPPVRSLDISDNHLTSIPIYMPTPEQRRTHALSSISCKDDIRRGMYRGLLELFTSSVKIWLVGPCFYYYLYTHEFSQGVLSCLM